MFELTKDNIRNLTPEQVRELVAQLCEAEVAAKGMPRSAVRWGGAQTAPDGGLDVEVRLEDVDFRGDYIPRAWTGIQVKKNSMAAARITSEMAPDGNLRQILADIVAAGGAYTKRAGEESGTAKRFGDNMRRRGFARMSKKLQGKSYKVYLGV